MPKLVQAILHVLAVTLFSACAGPAPKIDASPSAIAGIKTVAVIRPPEPKAYVLVHFGHPRGASAAGDLSGKQVILTAATREKNLPSPSERLATDLANQLRKFGFQARVEDGPWEESDGRFKIDVEKITSSADAVLIVNPTLIGFIAPGASSDYVPTVTAVVTLLGNDRKEPIYRGYHACGWHSRHDIWRSSSTPISFVDYHSLISDPERAADSLALAASAVASTVAEDLRR